MALYKLYNTDEGTQGVRKNLPGQILVIPFSEGNADYQEYLEWVAAGNTAEAAD